MKFSKKKELIFINLVLFVAFFSFCQKNISKNDYTIDGFIKSYEGKIYLVGYATPKYYYNNFKKDSSLVVDGKFEFKLPKENKYPMPYYLLTENDIMIGRFILEPKDHKIIIDSLYFKVKPKIIVENSTIIYEKKI